MRHPAHSLPAMLMARLQASWLMAIVTGAGALAVGIQPTRTAWIANVEGNADGYYLGDQSDTINLCQDNGEQQADCERVGFGHGNRVATLLEIDLADAIPNDADISGATLRVVEGENRDYDQGLELVLIDRPASEFGQLTWNRVTALASSTSRVMEVEKSGRSTWTWSGDPMVRLLSGRLSNGSTILLVRPTGQASGGSIDGISIHMSVEFTAGDLVAVSLSRDQLDLGFVVSDEGSRDGHFARSGANGVTCQSVLGTVNPDTAFPCGSGGCAPGRCPFIGFGHGNRMGVLARIPDGALPGAGRVYGAMIHLTEADNGDYNQDLRVHAITSSASFATHTWNSLVAGGGIGGAVITASKHTDDASYYIAGAALNALVGSWLDGSAPNRGIYIASVGTRRESTDHVARFTFSFFVRPTTATPTTVAPVTPRPSSAPSPTPTANPTRHACRDGSHGCDSTARGICEELGGGGHRCSCVSTHHCSDGNCQTPGHSCEWDTDSPTPAPTPVPTSGPTATPTTASPTTTSPTPSPTPAPTLRPTAHTTAATTTAIDDGSAGGAEESRVSGKTDSGSSSGTMLVVVIAVTVLLVAGVVLGAVWHVRGLPEAPRQHSFENPLYADTSGHGGNNSADAVATSWGGEVEGYMDVPAGSRTYAEISTFPSNMGALGYLDVNPDYAGIVDDAEDV